MTRSDDMQYGEKHDSILDLSYRLDKIGVPYKLSCTKDKDGWILEIFEYTNTIVPFNSTESRFGPRLLWFGEFPGSKGYEYDEIEVIEEDKRLGDMDEEELIMNDYQADVDRCFDLVVDMILRRCERNEQ